MTLYHIDEHADTRTPYTFLQREELSNVQRIFEYTNFEVNVGNYIVPAQKDGLISQVIQIRDETSLEEYSKV
jgi:hypothetical protein